MSKTHTNHKRVLALDPTTNGFGYVVLEGPHRLIDWGTKETEGDKKTGSLRLFTELMDRYHPDVLVTEDVSRKDSRRCARVRELIQAMRVKAENHKCQPRSFSRSKVYATFSEEGARTKYGIATAIAQMFPELAPRLPPFRKCWMSEDSRMSLFDAMAFALTYYRVTEERKRSSTPSDRNDSGGGTQSHITQI